jgi:hypothetical protein
LTFSISSLRERLGSGIVGIIILPSNKAILTREFGSILASSANAF